MSRETEHKIEGLLQAWAKQRREEVGADFELHPATRRLLLDEVARTFPQPARHRIDWGRLFGIFQRRAVGLAGFAVVAVIVLWGAKTFWGNFTNYDDMKRLEANPPQHIKFSLRKKEAQDERTTLADNAAARPAPTQLAKVDVPAKASSGEKSDGADKTKNILPPAPPAPATPVRDPFTLSSRRLPPGPKSGAFNPLATSSTATGSVTALTASLPAKSNNTVLLAGRGALRPAETGQEVAPVATAPAPAAAPAPARENKISSFMSRQDVDRAKTPGSAGGAAPATGLQFVRVDAAVPPAARSLALASPAQQPSALRETSDSVRLRYSAPDAVVLSQFELKRDGAKITLIEADGSVYEGTVVAPEPPAAAKARTAAPAASSRSGGVAEDFAFRAAGSSHSLQQRVVIDATVEGREAGAAALGGGKQTNSQLLQGTIRVGTNASQALRAVQSR